MTPHVLVTGGAAGIGAAVARSLVETGHRVSVVDRAPASSAAWWSEVRAENRGGWATADAGDAAELERAVAAVAGDDLAGLVACAGISVKEDFLDSTAESWAHTLSVNVVGTAVAARVAARVMSEGGGGSIVTVGSTAAMGYVNGLGAHYHASKGAILALTRALASELAPVGIRVNAVVPGLVRTPMTTMMRERHGDEALSRSIPLRHVAHAEEVAEVVRFLVGDDSRMVTGHCLPADAGQLAVASHPLGSFPAPVTAPESVVPR